MKPDLMSVSMWGAALLPVVAFLFWLTLEKRRRTKTEKPPQSEKLLRPPGYSLSIRLDELQESLLLRLFLPSAFCAFAGITAALFGQLVGIGAPAGWIVGTALVFAIFVAGGIFTLLSAVRLYRKFQNVRLGMRGEQAVAETLHEVADAGFRIFHDFPGGDNWNIDHIAVGPRGVFVLETKARRRRASRNGQPEHVVNYDGKMLQFPTGNDHNAISQAERNARWMADWLTKKTGEKVKTQAVVVIPGWFVKANGDFPVKAMNAGYLAGYLRRETEKVEMPQVRRIIAALDEKCRDLEF